MEDQTGQLSKEIKRLNFGQFLFLYFVARNTSFSFVRELLYKLKIKGAPDWVRAKKKEPEATIQNPDTNEKFQLQDMSNRSLELGPPGYTTSAPSLASGSNSPYHPHPNLEKGSGSSEQATLKIDKHSADEAPPTAKKTLTISMVKTTSDNHDDCVESFGVERQIVEKNLNYF